MIDLREVLKTAHERNASDVHLTVGIPPKLRIDGGLYDAEGFPRLTPDDTETIAAELLNERQKEHFARHGECDLSFSIPQTGRYRLNVYRQRGSVALAIRLVAFDVPTPEELGIPESVTKLTELNHGLVLVTGPAGSGKSTTLASLVERINTTREMHIITLEDPIEYMHRHARSIVNQREIGLDADSYADALRSALREDPDVIMVGEMRDLDTVSIAVTAAETGHLVFSTLHTIGAASTVDRMIDIFPSYQQQQIRIQLAGVLEAVISQQFIPKADGSGRIAAFEVMRANSAVRNMIRESKSWQLNSVIQTGRLSGMVTMDDSILQLYHSRMIDRNHAIQFAADPDAMQKRIDSGSGF